MNSSAATSTSGRRAASRHLRHAGWGVDWIVSTIGELSGARGEPCLSNDSRVASSGVPVWLEPGVSAAAPPPGVSTPRTAAARRPSGLLRPMTAVRKLLQCVRALAEAYAVVRRTLAE